MAEAPHTPVLLAEVLRALAPAPGMTIVDGTFGAGGYSRAFLAAGAEVVAFDRDPSARTFATGLDGRFRLLTGGRFWCLSHPGILLLSSRYFIDFNGTGGRVTGRGRFRIVRRPAGSSFRSLRELDCISRVSAFLARHTE